MEYESHFKSCPFYANWKADVRKHGPQYATKSSCSHCERKRLAHKKALAETDIDETLPLTELGGYF